MLSQTRHEGYVEHAEKAIAIDPDWLVARRNLGVAYLLAGEDEDAAREFEEVLKRNPHAVGAYAALSCAYLQMGKFEAAETAARRALEIDSSLGPSRYYLGVSLALQHKDESEALQHLQKISGRYPKAHLAEAQILERLGMKQAAKGQLEEYLSSGDTAAQAEVKTWLSSYGETLGPKEGSQAKASVNGSPASGVY